MSLGFLSPFPRGATGGGSGVLVRLSRSRSRVAEVVLLRILQQTPRLPSRVHLHRGQNHRRDATRPLRPATRDMASVTLATITAVATNAISGLTPIITPRATTHASFAGGDSCVRSPFDRDHVNPDGPFVANTAAGLWRSHSVSRAVRRLHREHCRRRKLRLQRHYLVLLQLRRRLPVLLLLLHIHTIVLHGSGIVLR